MKLNSRLFKALAAWPAALLCVMLLAGCASAGGGANTAAGGSEDRHSRPDISSDILRRGDRVIVTFSGLSIGLPKHEERIKDDGSINLPMVGDVMAAGLTRRALEQEIHRKYVPVFYKTLTVTVAGEERFFYVDGQVRSPGRHPYLGELTLLRAIAASGDFTDFANRKKVQVTRANGRKITVNCLKARENNSLDIPIYADDQIFVPRRYL